MESYLPGFKDVTVKNGSTGGNRLTPGNVLHAVVESGDGEGRYTISSGNLRMQVSSDSPLASGQKLDLMVVARPDGKIALQNLPSSVSAVVAGGETVTISKDILITLDSKAVKDFYNSVRDEQATQTSGNSEKTQTLQSSESLTQVETTSKTSSLQQNSDNLKAAEISVDNSADAVKADNSTDSKVRALAVSGDYRLFSDSKTHELMLETPTGEKIPVTLLEGSAANLARFIENGAQAQAIDNLDHGQVSVRGMNFVLELPVTVVDEDGQATTQTVRVAIPADSEVAGLLAGVKTGAVLDFVTAASADSANAEKLGQLVVGDKTIPVSLPAGLLENLVTGDDGVAKVRVSAGAVLEAVVRTTLTVTDAPVSNGDVAGKTPFDAFLTNAGLTPSAATREVAGVLHDAGLTINRENVQNLLALAAGKSGAERLQILTAGAKLINMDAPLSPSLAAGLSALAPEQPGVSARIENIIESLKSAAGNLQQADAQAITAQTRVMDTLSVLVSQEDTPQTLANFVRSYGREVLADTAAGIENAVSRLIDNSPSLKILSASLEVVLAKVSNLSEAEFQGQLMRAADSLASSVNGAGFENIQVPINPESGENIPQAPANLPVAENQSQPQVAQPESAEQQISADQSAAAGEPVKQAGAEVNLNQELLKPQHNTDAQAAPVGGESSAAQPLQAPVADDGAGLLRAALEKLNANTLMSMRADIDVVQIPRHPGVENFPESMKPVADNHSPVSSIDHQALRSAVERLEQANTPAQAAEIAREVTRTMDGATLREFARVLQHAEREEISSQPGMRELREAAASVRELGRAFVAQKLENIAGQRMNPEVYAASVPFRFSGGGDDGESGDGNLQMFYRKSKRGSGRDWTQRVVLELDMSALGNVVGDIRFYEGALNLALLTPEQESADWLESGLDELAENLAGVGFPCTPGVRLIRKAPKEEAQVKTSQGSGRLDIKA